MMEQWGLLDEGFSREVDLSKSICEVSGFWSSDSSSNDTPTVPQSDEDTGAAMVWGGRSVFITAGEEDLSSLSICGEYDKKNKTKTAASLRDYERITRLGRGGFGSVYKAKNKDTGEIVAIKVSQYAFPSIKEMEFLQMCNCPQIIKYHAAFKNSAGGGSPSMWMVIEYCGGGSVEDLIETEDLDMNQIATILLGLVQGVVYLHDHNILHRDIKPGNILLTSEGETKLADLGCSRELRAGEMAHTLMGTQAFMAPEFFVGGVGYTQKADIWAIGVTALDIAIRISSLDTPLFYLQLNKGDDFGAYLCSKLAFFPASFQDFVCSCLNRRPKDRPAAKELLEHPFFTEYARDARCLKQLCRTQEDRLNREKEVIEPLVRLGNASKSHLDAPLKEDLLGACVDVVERVKVHVDRLLRRSYTASARGENDVHHESLFNDMKRIVDTKTPRILVAGKAGSGKSSLVNALQGSYVAQVGRIGFQTQKPMWHKVENKGTSFFVMDSPGRQEVQQASFMEESFVLVEEGGSVAVSDWLSEDEEMPDIILFVCKASDINNSKDEEDNIGYLKEILCTVRRKTGSYPLVMGVVTHVDALEPITQVTPQEYGSEKKSNIEIARRKLHAKLVDTFATMMEEDERKKKKTEEDKDMMQLLLDTLPVSALMVWEGYGKQKFSDYRYNVNVLWNQLMGEKVSSRLAKFEEKRRKEMNGMFGLRWLKYFRSILEDVRTAGCSQGQYSQLADSVLLMLVRLVAAIYNAPNKDFDIFWKKFIAESNLVWDKGGAVGKIVAHQWGFFTWSSKPLECEQMLQCLYTAAVRYFSHVAFVNDHERWAKESIHELQKKLWHE